MIRRTFIFALAFLLGLIPPALAAASTTPPASTTAPITYTPPAWPDPPSTSSMLIRLLLAAAAVLSTTVATGWIAKRFVPGTPAAGSGDSRLQLIETLHLGSGSSLHLLECGGRRFVAGVSRAGLRSLAPVSESFDSELEALTSRI